LREVGTRNFGDDVGGGILDLAFCVGTRGKFECRGPDAFLVLIADEDLPFELIETW